MKKIFINTACFLTFALFLVSCNRGDGNPHPIPICAVDFRINTQSTDNDFITGMVKTFNHPRLGNFGCGHGWVPAGVVVVFLDFDDIRAFDMACPNCHWTGGVVIEWQLTARAIPNYFQCQFCESQFNPLDGTPMPGSATQFVMREYTATRINNWEIHVRN
ncbi:MAG: hypothetical protein FWD02_05505 [Bacteroidales bacterium]|nr:hypothetical protein [Bacteroidales bacterium]